MANKVDELNNSVNNLAESEKKLAKENKEVAKTSQQLKQAEDKLATSINKAQAKMDGFSKGLDAIPGAGGKAVGVINKLRAAMQSLASANIFAVVFTTIGAVAGAAVNYVNKLKDAEKEAAEQALSDAEEIQNRIDEANASAITTIGDVMKAYEAAKAKIKSDASLTQLREELATQQEIIRNTTAFDLAHYTALTKELELKEKIRKEEEKIRKATNERAVEYRKVLQGEGLIGLQEAVSTTDQNDLTALFAAENKLLKQQQDNRRDILAFQLELGLINNEQFNLELRKLELLDKQEESQQRLSEESRKKVKAEKEAADLLARQIAEQEELERWKQARAERNKGYASILGIELNEDGTAVKNEEKIRASFENISNTIQDGAQVVMDNTKEGSKAQEAALAVQKAAAIGSVTSATAKSIAETWAAYSEIPFAGPAIAGTLTAALVANGLLQVSNIKNNKIGSNDISTTDTGGGKSAAEMLANSNVINNLQTKVASQQAVLVVTDVNYQQNYMSNSRVQASL